jgi:hypothetical protein
MRRDEVEPLALFRFGYGRYGLLWLARVETRLRASLTAAMVALMRRARLLENGQADTCKSVLIVESLYCNETREYYMAASE